MLARKVAVTWITVFFQGDSELQMLGEGVHRTRFLSL